MEKITSAYAINLRDITGTRTLLSNLSTSLDTPINDSTDPREVLRYFQEKPLTLLIKANDEQAALVGFSKNMYKAPEHWVTTTLVFTKFRGSELNKELKRGIAEICDLNEIPLGAIVRDWNLRSFNAMRKAFPYTEPQVIPLKPKDNKPDSDSGWFFDLRTAAFEAPTVKVRKLDTHINEWWSYQAQNELQLV
jgi:hypothetical protein